MPMTPSGTRTLRIRRPFGRVHSVRTSFIGSGSAATSRTASAISLMRLGVRSKRSSIAPDKFDSAMSFALARRISSAWVSMASAIRSSNRFFSSVESCASNADAARARSSFSRVDDAIAATLTILGQPLLLCFCFCFRRKISSDLARSGLGDGVGIAAVDNCHADSGVAGHLCGAQFRTHSAAAQLAVAIAQSFHLRSELANSSQHSRTLSIGNIEAIHIGEQQQPIGFDRSCEERAQFVVIAEGAFQFADGNTVILIDDGNNAQAQQLVKSV